MNTEATAPTLASDPKISARRVLLTTVVGAMLMSASTAASAAECYQINGWSSTNLVAAEALVSPTSCAVTPSGTAWLWVSLAYGAYPNDSLYLRISLSDSHMSGTVFSPLLVFSHYNLGLPVVMTDLIASNGGNQMQATVNPPVQGNVLNRARVRLRHRNTGNCLVSGSTNGAIVRNLPCSDASDQIYELVYAGSNTYRLRHEQYNQCVYTLPSNGGTVHSWGCWPDSAMRFKFVAANGGFRLRNIDDSQCIYGNPAYNGYTHSWGCWNDSAMIYQVDIVEYAPVSRPGPLQVRRN